jgi:hypothetical protein
MQVFFGVITFLVGVLLLWMGFAMESDVIWTMVGVGAVLSVTGYKVVTS